MSFDDKWYYINNVDEIDSPALLVYPERVKANIQTAVQMIGDVNRLRPHIKTHKCSQIVKLMMEAGIHKFKCATIAEAEMLGITKAKDVLLAYQPLGPKLKRFIELIKKYPGTRFSSLVDNMHSAVEQSKSFMEAGLRVSVYLDLNVGMNRTGIRIGNEAIKLYDFCSRATGIDIKGVHVYDGHIREADYSEKKNKCDAAFSEVEELVKQVIRMGLSRPIIIAGGSPTFSVHCKRNEVECSPGTFIYWDKGYADICPEQAFIPAAVLLTRVISLPAEGKICTDLGHKSVAAENKITKRVFFPDFDSLIAVGQSEEHLVLENNTTTTHRFKPGDVLYVIPYHICPSVALYDSVKVIENAKYIAEWKNTARDRKITI